MEYQPVIIIGAPRSGTNMLRDMLVQLEGVGTWPCDEINYIWRHGNVRYPSDEFPPELATPTVQTYIRKQFDAFASGRNLDTVVEKTCANSLRVGFVDRAIPDAKYIFIVRDGMDAVGSAMQRWIADLDIRYILKKAKYVPLTDLPYYALRYFYHRLYRLISKENRLAIWGPVIADLDNIGKRYSLTEICALQWKACLDLAERDFANIDSSKIIRLKYEDFVSDPVTEFAKLAEFLNKKVPDGVNDYLRNSIRDSSIGRGRSALGKAGVDALEPLLRDTLEHYGYE